MMVSLFVSMPAYAASKIKQVDAGFNKTFILRDNGKFEYTKPFSSYGEGNISNVQKIAAVGRDGYVALLKDGTVIRSSTFSNSSLGWSNIKEIDTNTDTSDDLIVGLREDGTVVVNSVLFKENFSEVESWDSIKQISVGQGAILGLKEDGTVVSAGTSTSGALDVSEWSDIVQVSAASGWA